jgi:predicted NUDIX family phosphoesterase
MSVNEEKVLVVPRELLERLGAFQGLSFDVSRYLPYLLDPSNNQFRSRDNVEHDPSFKQLIPYVLVAWNDRILRYHRGKTGGEGRLFLKGSIGIGGHIKDSDFGGSSLDQKGYFQGVLRELHEELAIQASLDNRVVALLNDDSNDVGKVHLGLIHIVRVSTSQVTAREMDIVNPEFLSVGDLNASRDTLESWSQICLDSLDRLMAATGLHEE